MCDLCTPRRRRDRPEDTVTDNPEAAAAYERWRSQAEHPSSRKGAYLDALDASSRGEAIREIEG